MHADRMSGGIKPTPAQIRLRRQMEKDERFWVATALMSLYHEDGGVSRGQLFSRLLGKGGLRPPAPFARWEEALSGQLELYFEVSLPSPPSYQLVAPRSP